MKHLLIIVAFDIIVTVFAAPILRLEPLRLINVGQSNGLHKTSRLSQVTQNNNGYQQPIENKVTSGIQGKKGASKPSRVVIQENPTIYYNDAPVLEPSIFGNQEQSEYLETHGKSDENQEKAFNIPTIEVEPCRCDKMLMKMVTTGNLNPEIHPPKVRVKN